MVRTHVMQYEFIKRSGIIAASLLIATLAVIINANSASAFHEVKSHLSKSTAPKTHHVHSLANKDISLSVTKTSANKHNQRLGNVADVHRGKAPTFFNGFAEDVPDPRGPVAVANSTITAVQSASFQTPSNDQSNTPPPANTIATDTAVAMAPTQAPNAEPDTDLPAPQQTPFRETASSFTSTLPTTMQNIASNIAGKEVGMMSIVISILLFLMTLSAVGGIVHASNHGGALSMGRYRFALFANGKDRTEMATFIIVAICFGIVAIFLALTVL